MAIPSGIPYFQELFCTAVGNQLVDLPSNPAYFVQAASVLNFNGWGGRTGTVQAGARVYLGAIQPWNATEKRGLIWDVPDVRPNLGTVLNGATPIFGQLAAGTYPLIVVGVYNSLISTDIPLGFQTGSGTLVISGALPDDPPSDPVPDGKYEQEVVTWTGDGAAGRLIPTTFPLDTGIALVWVLCRTFNAVPGFRHSGMSGTSFFGGQQAPTTQAITGFTAAGFTVGTGPDYFSFNTLDRKYTAIVFHDSTWDGITHEDGTLFGRFLTVGFYRGQQDTSFSPDVVAGDPHFYIVAGGVPSIDHDGRPYSLPSIGASGIYHYISTNLGSGYNGSFNGRVAGTIFALGKTLRSGFTNRLVLMSGIQGIFRPSNYVGDKALILENILISGVTNRITSMTEDGVITLGSSNQVMNASTNFFWMAFSTRIPETLFTLFHGMGKVGGGVTIAGLAMIPKFAMSVIDETTGIGAWWKGPTHTGTLSSRWSGGDDSEVGQRIQTLGDGTITIGIYGAPEGLGVDGFAMEGGTVLPDYDPPVYPNQPPIDEAISLGASPSYLASEGRGIVIVVPDPTDPDATDLSGSWSIDRVDVKVRLEEES